MPGKNRELGNLDPWNCWHLEGNFTSKIKKYIKKWREILIEFPGKRAFFPAVWKPQTNTTNLNLNLNLNIGIGPTVQHPYTSGGNPDRVWCPMRIGCYAGDDYFWSRWWFTAVLFMLFCLELLLLSLAESSSPLMSEEELQVLLQVRIVW